MPMLCVARVILSPAFAQSFTVHRMAGGFVGGKFETMDTPLAFFGTIAPLDEKELEQVPEGDRVKGTMAFYATREMFVTNDNPQDGQAYTSDQIEWRGFRYRVFQVLPMADFGYYQAIGVRMAGD